MGILEGRVAIVTGASRGIGAAIATALAREGAPVAVNYNRRAAQAAAVADAIRAAGGRALAIGADVTGARDVQRMVDVTLETFGRVDILVNNAGILNRGPLHTMPEEVWDGMVATNLKSVFLCSRAVLPHMLARSSGKIINISSTLGLKGLTGHVHYATTKGGIIAFTKALAREVGPKGINVNAIAPGPIETDLIGPVDDEFRKRTGMTFALRRMGRPEDVAPTVVFLASDAAAYYAGQTFCPNGGDLML